MPPASNKDDPPEVTLDVLEDLHSRIEEAAANSDWSLVEALMAERNSMLDSFGNKQRPAALEAARKSTDRILELAKSARLELAGELAKLQKGRKATDIYRAHR